MALLDLIRAADLTPTEHLLLEKFVHDAVDPTMAAQYLEARLTNKGTDDVETCLRQFKREWRQLTMRGTYFNYYEQRQF